MNRLNLGFLFICTLTMLISCGGGGGGATLEVSTGALTSSGAFQGGLVIHGKSTTTKDEFLVPLELSMNTTITIPYGTYNVRVVGWDMPQKFVGSSYCGSSLFNFTKESPTLTVTPSMVACAGTEFGESATTGNSFKTFKLKSCGALYDPASKTQLAAPSTHSCDVPNYDPADIERVGSYKVVFKSNLPSGGTASALESACQQEAMTGTLKIPTKIPVSILLFKDTNCTKLIRENSYPRGLADAGNRVEHKTDSTFQSDYSQNILLVTSSPSGRGTTPFLTERPAFKCSNTEDCVLVRNLSSNNYLVTEGKVSTIRLPYETTCPTNITPAVINHCTVKEDGVYLTLTLMAGSATFTHNSTSYTIEASAVGEVEIYKMLQRSIGMNIASGNFLSHSLAENNNDETEYAGALQTVRDLLGPKYLGGVFWDQTCSPSATFNETIERSIVVMEDGVPKTFKVTLSKSNKILPARFNNGISEVPLHRKLKVQKLINAPSGYKTEHVVDFACDADDDILLGNIQMGRIESSWEDKFSGGITETEKRLIYWSTNVGSLGKIEMYTTDKKFDSTQVLRLNNRYMQANLLSSLTFKVNELEYNVEGSSGSYQETLKNNELDGELYPGTKTVLTKREIAALSKQNSASPGFIFNGVSFQKKRSTIYYNAGTSNAKLQGQTVRRAGRIYQIGHHQISSTLIFTIRDEATGILMAKDYPLTGVTKIGMSVSASGGHAVVYALQGGMVHYLTWRSTDTAIGNWQNFGSMINDADVAILDGTGKYVFVTVDNNGIISQASGEVGLSFPSTETPLTNYGTGGEVYSDVSMVATTTKIHTFIAGDMAGQKNLYHCEMSNTDNDCEKTLVDSPTGNSISEIEPFYNSSAGKIYVNYKTNSAYKMAYLVSAGNFTQTTESDFNYQYGSSTENSIDSSTGNPISPIHVYGEYYNSFENYDMNFNALNPLQFESHFNGFEN